MQRVRNSSTSLRRVFLLQLASQAASLTATCRVTFALRGRDRENGGVKPYSAESIPNLLPFEFL
jgi:hypothetical protein